MRIASPNLIPYPRAAVSGLHQNSPLKAPYFGEVPAASLLKEVTDTSFKHDVVEASKKLPVLVLFHASWCPPCKVFMKRAEQLAHELKGQSQFTHVLTSDSTWLGIPFPMHNRHFKEYGGVTYPSIMIFANGKPQQVFQYYERNQFGMVNRNKLVPGQPIGSPSSLSDQEIRILLKNAQAAIKQ
jgi:thiol-disulfide isomerase/thioredoxin